MENESKLLQTRLVQLEMLLTQATKIRNNLLEKLPEEEKKALIENSEEITKLSEEYSKICTVLNAAETKSEKAAISRDYANVKALLEDVTPAELSLKVNERGSCWTSCETCVTACVKCVTDVGLSPGNLCGLTSLISSPCRPKIDIGEQDFYVDIDKMYVKWKDE
jgi:hypothetical protein